MAGIYDNCAQCGAAMHHPLGRGKAKKYCSAGCQKIAEKSRDQCKTYAKCTIDGCGCDAVRVGHGLCEKHYMRMRRNNTVVLHKDRNPPPLLTPAASGYVLAYLPQHPLRTNAGGPRVSQHRAVYYDAHGEGPFNCHWCSKEVTWQTLHIDHLDDDKSNNSLSNLVASCPICNQQRGLPKAKATRRAKTGITIDGVCRTLNEWAEIAGINRTSIIARIKQGWSYKDAVFKPRGQFGPRSSGK